MTVLYVVLGVIILMCIVLLPKMTLDIRFHKSMNDEGNSKIILKAFWLKLDLLKPAKKGQKSPVQQSSKKIKEPLPQRIKQILENIERGKYTYLLSKRYVRKKIKIKKLDFSLTFGLDDAAHTGIATGVAWGSVYNIFAFLDKLFTVKSHKFNIIPVFEGEAFEIDFQSKIRFSVLNLLSLAFVIFVNYIKSKEYLNMKG